MAAKTGTYTLINSTTLTTSAATVTFSSIPATYTDVVLIANATTTSNSWDLYIRFNGDAGSNYSVTRLFGNGTTPGSNRLSSDTLIQSTYWASLGTEQTNHIINIMDYANATTNKTMLLRGNRAGQGVDASVGLWRNTAAISSINLLLFSGGNFATGSNFKLYGIEAAK
jgi:hypothetical protein